MEKTCVESIHIVARMITRTTDYRESAELNTDIFLKNKAVLVFAASWLPYRYL